MFTVFWDYYLIFFLLIPRIFDALYQRSSMFYPVLTEHLKNFKFGAHIHIVSLRVAAYSINVYCFIYEKIKFMNTQLGVLEQ